MMLPFCHTDTSFSWTHWACCLSCQLCSVSCWHR